jgi:hypothetical protein
MNDINDVDLTKYVGATISRVCRLRYQLGENVDSDDDGAIEVSFSTGATLYCEPGPDGDSVRVRDTVWIDPFAGQLSPENEEYVRTSGKWTKHDVSDENLFADLIDRKLIDIAPMSGSTGKLYGLLLNVSGYLLAVYANADELHVRLLT